MPGNPGGPGNPFAARVARLRTLIYGAVTDDDLRAIVGVLVSQAKDGDLAAIREVLDRLVGKANAPLEIESTPSVASLLDFAAAVRQGRSAGRQGRKL